MSAIVNDVVGDGSISITGNASGHNTYGLVGRADTVGVQGESKVYLGMYGVTASASGGAGVMGESTAEVSDGGTGGLGVYGKSKSWTGVYGESQSSTGGAAVWGDHKNNGRGVIGTSVGGAGVTGVSESDHGVHAETKSGSAALAAYNLHESGEGTALFAHKAGTAGHAGVFEGNVWVRGVVKVDVDITLANADLAEDFDVCASGVLDPGTVVVLADEGGVAACDTSYDTRVAGVISGAGTYRPAIVLDRHTSDRVRQPVALMGKVYCKVDARSAAACVGDLLTTSSTTGHAMKAGDAVRAFGAVVGKALEPLDDGIALIPVLVSIR